MTVMALENQNFNLSACIIETKRFFFSRNIRQDLQFMNVIRKNIL